MIFVEKVYDMIIIGGGPAGLTAAIYAGRANLKVLVIEIPGRGSLLSAHKIDNYPGFPEGITGKELYDLKREHALRYGVEIEEGVFLELDTFETPKIVKTTNKNYKAKSVIIASGWTKNSFNKISGETEFLGKGVSYCATCDGAFTKGLTVSLFGQGEELAHEALFLTRHAQKVMIFTDESEFQCDRAVYEALLESDKVEIITGASLKKIDGSRYVEKILVSEEAGETLYNVDYVFLYLGTKSSAELFSGFANLDENGYIVTNDKMETGVEGVYAAGDVRAKSIRQVTTAVSDGTIASMEAIKYLLKNSEK